MKRTITILTFLLLMLTAGAQTYSVRQDAISIDNDTAFVNKAMRIDPHQFKAGQWLRESANYDAASWVLAAVSGVFFSGIVTGDDRSMGNTVGTAAAVGSVVSKILSVRYKWKSGKELQLSAGRLRITF